MSEAEIPEDAYDSRQREGQGGQPLHEVFGCLPEAGPREGPHGQDNPA